MNNLQKGLLISIILITLDQIIKFWIKTNMTIGESFPFLGLSWFDIRFVENEGMAFGWKLGEHNMWKLVLSLFRTVAIGGIIWYLVQLSKRKAAFIASVAVSFILAGAIGNLIDSAFYGILFDESTTRNVAQFLPEAGYEKLMYGRVVDMFAVSFFPPIFNFADATISVGVGLVILFRKKFIFEELQADKNGIEPIQDEEIQDESEITKQDANIE